MKEKLHEQISALVDNELAETEQVLLSRRLAEDASLRSRLSRYQLISDSLQNHLPRKINPDFNIGVQLALQDEPAVQARSARLARLFKPVAGLAVAASVAVVAVLSLQSVRQEIPSVSPALATAPVVDELAPVDVAPLLANTSSNVSGDAQNLDIYLVNHNEFAVNRGMQGILPYVRLVGHDMNVDDKE
ncbi:MAG: sigma-E factor negative regulatory protein [Gammaproteobacteria bacterium]|nr:sigma-E factor negative regulatory protein [Gammaproteobacteria bacterium]